MPHRLYDLVAARAHHRCEYCLAPEAVFNSSFDVEHIQPREDGGSDEEWNLALACRSCNGSKFTAMGARDPETGQIVRLYHPRTDVWSEHFVVDVRSSRILGLTDVGRATVARLRINGPKQREARQLWILLLGFPDDRPVPGDDIERES